MDLLNAMASWFVVAYPGLWFLAASIYCAISKLSGPTHTISGTIVARGLELLSRCQEHRLLGLAFAFLLHDLLGMRGV